MIMKNKATNKIDASTVAKHWDTHGKAPPKQWFRNLHLREKELLKPLDWHGGCWFNWLKRTYFKSPVNNALSLCCGSGQHERRLAQVNIAKHIVGIYIFIANCSIEKSSEVGVSLQGKKPCFLNCCFCFRV